jgi:DNA-directed RNA polymerase subunit beta'
MMIHKWRQINVFDGETVEKGDVISDGPSNPHDILRLLGVEALAVYSYLPHEHTQLFLH